LWRSLTDPLAPTLRSRGSRPPWSRCDQHQGWPVAVPHRRGHGACFASQDRPQDSADGRASVPVRRRALPPSLFRLVSRAQWPCSAISLTLSYSQQLLLHRPVSAQQSMLWQGAPSSSRSCASLRSDSPDIVLLLIKGQHRQCPTRCTYLPLFASSYELWADPLRHLQGLEKDLGLQVRPRVTRSLCLLS